MECFIRLGPQNNVSHMQFYCYCLGKKTGFNHVLQSGPLFQYFGADTWLHHAEQKKFPLNFEEPDSSMC